MNMTEGQLVALRLLKFIESNCTAYQKSEKGVRVKFTRVIKEALRHMAEERGFTQHSTADEGGEFHVDVVWFHRDSGSSMPLAVESEFNSGEWEFVRDFRKLLHLKATTKLMICDPSPYNWIEGVAMRELTGYDKHQAGEEYLILYLGCWPYDGSKGCGCQPTLWSWSPEHDGDTSVQLKVIPVEPITLKSTQPS